jgi:phage antirepressor YoqD-like protein
MAAMNNLNNNLFLVKVPALDELLPQVLELLKLQAADMAEIKELLRSGPHDEREWLTANKFCMNNGISRKTMDKRVSEGLIEVDESLGVKRYRKAAKS